MANKNGEITQLLAAWSRAEPGALDRLFPLVFQELRQLAHHHLRRHRPPGITLQPTVLVHEAYLRLVRRQVEGFDSRRHFFAFASGVLRGILVDHARAKTAAKRGGAGEEQGLEEARLEAHSASIDPDHVLAVHEALEKLEALHPRQARVVELRYFGGLTMPEIAQALDLSGRTVERDWQAAQRWLALRLGS